MLCHAPHTILSVVETPNSNKDAFADKLKQKSDAKCLYLCDLHTLRQVLTKADNLYNEKNKTKKIINITTFCLQSHLLKIVQMKLLMSSYLSKVFIQCFNVNQIKSMQWFKLTEWMHSLSSFLIVKQKLIQITNNVSKLR